MIKSILAGAALVAMLIGVIAAGCSNTSKDTHSRDDTQGGAGNKTHSGPLQEK